MNTVTNFIGNLFKQIDTIGENFIEQGYGGIATEVNTILRSLLVLYVVIWGYQILFGRSNATPGEAAFRLFKVFMAVWMATEWGAFSKSIYQLVQSIPVLISDAMIDAIAGSNGNLNGGASDVSGVSKILTAIFEAVMKIYGVYSDNGTYIVGPCFALVVLAVTIVFVAICTGIIVVSKLMLFIMLALAPAFIILAMFGYTFRFTEGWMTTIFNFMVQQVLIYALLAFFYSIVAATLTTAINDTAGEISKAVPLLLVLVLGIFIVSQVGAIAGVVTGGGAIGVGTAGRNAWSFSRSWGYRWGITSKNASKVVGRGIAKNANSLSRNVDLGHYSGRAKSLQTEILKNSGAQ